MEQSEPEHLLYNSSENEKRKQMDEVRRHIATALEAAQDLFEARMNIIRHAMRIPGCRYFREDNENEWGDEGHAVYATCERWVAEGFRRDLEALSFCHSWLEEGCVAPALRPGRQELLFPPALNALAADVDDSYTDFNEGWKQQQNEFMNRFSERYGDEAQTNRNGEYVEPFTGMNLLREEDGNLTRDTLLFLINMRKLIRWERDTWECYLEAMRELVTPYYGFHGSGRYYFLNEYESRLLDSRERFLCLLTVGCKHLNKLSKLPAERHAALQALHTEHDFGEIFTCDAHIFRHPELEGHPWCIRFDRQGAGFIFVVDSPALQHFISLYPEGGDVEVRGYQSIESRGTPYVPAEKEDDEEEEENPPTRPQTPFELRQVFHLLACTDLEEGEQE